MIRPSGSPEPVQREWVELHNPDATDLDLSGAHFDKGVAYTFPAGTALPAGGYLVVVSNVAAFQAANASVSAPKIFGPWTGGLANSAETVRLVDATGSTLAEVSYATEGEWARRVRTPSDNGVQGWGWSSPADGGGKTLELITPTFEPEKAQSFGFSTPTGGTPAAANSIAAADVAPLILDVKHDPAVPRPTDVVKVSADLVDAAGSTVTGTLFWRVSNASPGPFAAVPMVADVSGKFSATLPAQAALTVVEFYIRSSDGALTRTFPAPNDQGQTTNCLYQVDTETVAPGTAIYRTILSIPEANTFNTMSHSSDSAMNCTFIGDDGSGPEIRYMSDLRFRGASSRDFNPAPNRINIPNDKPYNGSSKLNLNSKFTWLQFMGMKLMEASGLRAPETKKVAYRRNGVVLASSSQTENYGWHVHVEPLSSEFVDNHFGADSAGDLYKKVRPEVDWAYRAGNVNAYLADGWVKESNSAANDWSKLDEFTRIMNQTQGRPDYFAQVAEVADVEQWARWFAAESILTNGETNASNGADDDYSLYFSGIDGRASFVPHDFDTILGQGDSSRITDTSRTLFDMTETSAVLNPLVPLFGTTGGGGVASFRAMYFTALRDLCLTSFSKPRFDQMLDTYWSGWVPASKIQEVKVFMDARRAFVLQQCATALGTPTPPAPAGTAVGTLVSPLKALSINEVLAKNGGAVTVDGGAPDFVEIVNAGAADIDLEGLRLTFTPGNQVYTFPAGATVAAGGRFVVYGGTGLTTLPDLGFGIDADGGTLSLLDAESRGGAVLDAVAFGPQAADRSIGRTGDGTVWTLIQPSPGAPNGSALTLGQPTSVKINEWMAGGRNRYDTDFVELYNDDTAPVAIGGTRLSDDPINQPNRHVFPALSFLAPKGFLTLKAVGGSATAQNWSELPFSLKSDHDRLTFSGANQVVIDEVWVLTQPTDQSQGRSPDGAAAWQFYALPTPGLANATSAKIAADPAYARAVTLMNSIRVTELHYNPGPNAGDQEKEFIEIRNIGAAAVNLAGLRFNRGIDFDFPSYMLAPGAYAVVAANVGAFESLYGPDLPLIGATTDKFSNGGETVSLQLPAPFSASVQIFRYKDTWYPATDGGGKSLVIVSQTAELAAWDRRSGWTESPAAGGTPGSSGPPEIVSPLTASVVAGTAFNYQIVATNEPTGFSASSLPVGLAIDTAKGTITGTTNDLGVFNIQIGATNGAGTDLRTLVLTVLQQPLPVITSPLTAQAYTTAVFNYTITATNNPSSYAASDLPPWLTYNATTHTLSGQPTALGSFTATISATNSGGTTSATLTIGVTTDPVSTALDGLGLAYTRGGNAQWFVQTTTTHDGVDAMQAGDIGDGDECWVETTVTGPDQLSFWWKCDSEESYDFLNFNVDGTTVDGISGAVDWVKYSYTIPEGTHVVRWVYRKDGSVSTSADTAWLDDVRLASQSPEPVILSPTTANGYAGVAFSYQIVATRNPTSYGATGLPAGLGIDTATGLISGTPTAAIGTYTVTLSATSPTGSTTQALTIFITSSPAAVAAALDGAGLSFTRGGDRQWFVQNAVTHDGVDAVRSGAIGANQETWIETTVTGPDRVSFWWKVSSYQYGGYLYFMNDDSTVRQISGEVDWQRVVYDVPEGQHTLRWRYSRGSTSYTEGSDAAWLDQVAVASLTPEPTILSDPTALAYQGQPFSYQISATRDPVSFGATALPAGLTVDPATGIISGIPTTVGSSNVTLLATGATGTGSGLLFLHVTSAPAVFDSALDAPAGVTFQRTGTTQWRAQSAVTHDGVDAAQAPPVALNDQASFSVTSSGAERVTFWWRISMSSDAGYLYCYADGNWVGSISGESGWQQVAVDLGPGQHVISWTLYKYGSTVSGSDTAWVDQVRFGSKQAVMSSPVSVAAIVGQPFSYQVTSSLPVAGFTATGLPPGMTFNPQTAVISGTPMAPGAYTVTVGMLAEIPITGSVTIYIGPSPAGLAIGGDGMRLDWNHSFASDAYWFTNYAVSHDGVDALQSGSIRHSQRTSFTVGMTGPGVFSCWWKVSSEQYSDYLYVYRDESQWDWISGTVDWQQLTINIPSGYHTIRFEYSKDSSTSSGSDAGWVDQLAFVPGDADTDGLPDWWETQYFLDGGNPGEDSDGDGYSNAAEFAAGTDPLNPASNCAVVSATVQPDRSLTLSWDAIIGKTYALQWSDDLNTWRTHPVRYYATSNHLSANVAPLNTTVSSATLVTANAPVKLRVPTSDIGILWRGGDETAFAAAGGDTAWTSGTQGVGYETDPNASSSNVPYTSYIGADVRSVMYNQRTSVYIRIPFTVANPSLLRTLTLQMRYDDGFVAYINGSRVAGDNDPSTLVYNSAATTSRGDSSAVSFRNFDMSAWISLLRPGTNVLAIQGLNQTAGSSDMLIQAQMLGSTFNALATPAKIYWRVVPQ